MERREFLKSVGAAAGLAAPGRGVAIVIEPADPVATAAPAKWAAGELQQALAARGAAARIVGRIADAPAGELCVLACGTGSPVARQLLKTAPGSPETVALAQGTSAGRQVVLAAGSDVRGLVYALLELADRVRYGAAPLEALAVPAPIVERPANTIRSIARAFVSDVEDKAWYNDRSFWLPYLSMLAAQRFNRFSLTFGIGYDFPRNIRDCYFFFPYPFLVSVPGYNVRAAGLPEGERERNLEMLRFIGEQTAARGLHFQLALWTHAYKWEDSPEANYTIEGLTAENHAAYCRDALLAILRACPAISGVTFRVHGESGVPEGSFPFWRTVFDALVRSGRKVEIDMHAKGMDQAMIDVALSTGLPVNISPKFWAEHMGLPYHQAAIRELERPPRESKDTGFFSRSNGSRRFLRYGYGDLLTEGRRYGILYRIWPGTQHLLLWGDPAMAAGYSRASSFCDSAGVEICEPLFFKGRKGSGLPGGRCAYRDSSLIPRYDWEKYLYTYRLWGRLLYNPNAEPVTWRRFLGAELGAGAGAAEAALAHSSRILPMVTTAHGVSGSNNAYWPEMYTNMPIVDATRRHPYGDTPSPKRFGTVSPFDPELFATVEEFAAQLVEGKRGGKYSPLQVAQWLDDFAARASGNLAKAEASGEKTPAFRRMSADVAIESGLGRFFAGKLRSAVLYAVYERTGDRAALREALAAYQRARSAWAELGARAREVYVADVTFGFDKHLRGHWLDRLAGIEVDIGDMERRLAAAKEGAGGGTERAIQEVLSRPALPPIGCTHKPPARFRPGQPLELELSLEKAAEATLHYRHVNQAEYWLSFGMEAAGRRRRAVIPGAYTASPYELQYYFELRAGPDSAWLYPGLGRDLSNQPYYVVRR